MLNSRTYNIKDQMEILPYLAFYANGWWQFVHSEH
jgi:hypothetical protein